MSKKSTRSSKPTEETVVPAAKAPALYKVMFISKELLEDPENELTLEYFYHPGKGKPTLFITKSNTELMEVKEFAEPRRCWLINNDVCSNGRIYMTTPIDITLLALHHIRLHCTQKALALDDIGEADDKSTLRLLREFVRGEEHLRCIADIKKANGMVFYKYNAEKTLAWLAIKTRRVTAKLRSIGVHCGESAMSKNYVRGELEGENGEESDMDYLRMACDIVGDYLDVDLHEELKKYLEIPEEKPLTTASKKEEKEKAGKKRKSLQQLNSNENKKIKLEDKDKNATDKLKSSGLVDGSPTNDHSRSNSSSSEEVSPLSVVQAPITPSPVKERNLTAKEKALAKSAKVLAAIKAVGLKAAHLVVNGFWSTQVLRELFNE
ncbi:ribonuclease H2 subunit B isoform X4 [Bactrocera neohumeralis]|uniref:ribonuclease H2 subunit B isoform X4 n=1 Tax=Bactrocera neohumeralis TaxID=98809 RepID=UPI0021667CB3|nr:ribonuclease H2 subunit B isoform X4 [Bactrocera neohumeralis]